MLDNALIDLNSNYHHMKHIFENKEEYYLLLFVSSSNKISKRDETHFIIMKSIIKQSLEINKATKHS